MPIIRKKVLLRKGSSTAKKKVIRKANGVTRIIRANYKGGRYSKGWSNLTAFVKKRDGYMCVKCGRSHEFLRKIGLELTVNHIRPIARGGTDHPSNLQSECSECHSLEYRHRRMKRKMNLEKKRAKAKKQIRIEAVARFYPNGN